METQRVGDILHYLSAPVSSVVAPHMVEAAERSWPYNLLGLPWSIHFLTPDQGSRIRSGCFRQAWREAACGHSTPGCLESEVCTPHIQCPTIGTSSNHLAVFDSYCTDPSASQGPRYELSILRASLSYTRGLVFFKQDAKFLI